TIRSSGDSSFDAAGRLGSVLISLRETAAGAAQQMEGTLGRLGKLLQDLPAEAAGHAQQLRAMLDQQAGAMTDLSSRVNVAFDRVQAIESKHQPAAASLKAPQQQQSIPNFSVPPAGHLAPPRGQSAQHAGEQMNGEPRGWFGLAKRFVRAPGEGP